MNTQHSKSPYGGIAISALLLAATGVFTPAAHAQLELNFLPATRPVVPDKELKTFLECGRDGEESCIRGLHHTDTARNKYDPDKTPFFMEMARDQATGIYYYHTLIGSKDSDFAQEYYIAVSGGFWVSGFPRTASAGDVNGGIDSTPPPSPFYSGAPFHSPLSASPISGNGSGRPDEVVFKQTLKGPGFLQEVTKASASNKPKITQTVNDSGISSNFVIDLSSLIYYGAAALTTGAPMTNTLVITDTQTNEVLTNFDINTSSQKSNMNAGKYTYALGNGFSGSNGTYAYETGTYDIYSTNWEAFSDPTLNVPNF